MKIEELVRPNILNLIPYASARGEFKGQASVFLDANENSLGSPTELKYNRYPDPLQLKLKTELAKTLNVSTDQLFLGNGSDEAIDILFRVFCEPGKDSVVICPPTYGMYEVSANINDVRITKVSLTEKFQIDQSVLRIPDSKLLFLCSPNNPTGNDMDREEMIRISKEFKGIVVIDEAYIHFSDQESMLSELSRLPNLVILRTFSKAIGMAGIRLGIAIASPVIIGFMNKVKPPYNVSDLTQEMGLKALSEGEWTEAAVKDILSGRKWLENELIKIPGVQKVYPSAANFLLVKFKDAKRVYQDLIKKGIVVRDRSKVQLCEDCLRITVGSREESAQLIENLKLMKSEN